MKVDLKVPEEVFDSLVEWLENPVGACWEHVFRTEIGDLQWQVVPAIQLESDVEEGAYYSKMTDLAGRVGPFDRWRRVGVSGDVIVAVEKKWRGR